MARQTIVLMAGLVMIALAGGGAVLALGRDRDPDPETRPTGLKGSNLGRLRREALVMFPRGSPVAATSEGLSALGFKCAPTRHMLPNTNAPSVQCESAGRGYPAVSRIQVTVIARNGVVSDIAFGGGYDGLEADARTPNPPVPDDDASAAAGKGKGSKEGAEAKKEGAEAKEAGAGVEKQSAEKEDTSPAGQPSTRTDKDVAAVPKDAIETEAKPVGK